MRASDALGRSTATCAHRFLLCRGKIYAQSTGVYRPKRKNTDDVVDPYATLRDWGSRQEPPMTVEEVVAYKMAEKKKVEISPETLLATLQLQHKG